MVLISFASRHVRGRLRTVEEVPHYRYTKVTGHFEADPLCSVSRGCLFVWWGAWGWVSSAGPAQGGGWRAGFEAFARKSYPYENAE
jgi:hypothetical protein